MAERPDSRQGEEQGASRRTAAPTADLSDAVMHTLAEESPDAIVVVDARGRVAWINRQAGQLFGYGRAELIGQSVDVLLPDGLQQTHLAHRAVFMESPRTRPMGVGLDLKARRRDDVTFPVEISLTPLSTDSGDMVIATVRDVSERRAIAEEQAALRRVATLVARGESPEDVFAAVAAEVGRVLGVDYTATSRYEPDGTRVVVAAWARAGAPVVAVGTEEILGGPNVPTVVFETGRPARIDRYGENAGPAARAAVAAGVRSAVGAPIRVEGRLWGLMNVYSTELEPLPADTEERLARFTELVATAIANAEARAQLAASRARIVVTSDAIRRRIERDLHDGTQQRLVSVVLQLHAAQAMAPSDANELAGQLDRAVTALEETVDTLREIARGIHPSTLVRGGLRPALMALARHSEIPIHLDVGVVGRLPEQVELAAYYLVSEALTNTAKHASASEVHIDVAVGEGSLRIEVRDDGRGGATPGQGSGLVGLQDRVEAIGGQLSLYSPRGAGTTLTVALPLDRGDETWLPLKGIRRPES